MMINLAWIMYILGNTLLDLLQMLNLTYIFWMSDQVKLFGADFISK